MLVSKILEFAREELAENKIALEAVEKELFKFNPAYDMSEYEMSISTLKIVARIMIEQDRPMEAKNVVLIRSMFEDNKNKLPKELVYPIETAVKGIERGFVLRDFLGSLIEEVVSTEGVHCDDCGACKGIKDPTVH